MYYKIKISNMPGIKGIVTYLTESDSVLDVAKAVENTIDKYQNNYIDRPEVEEIKLMKNFKPAINEKFADTNKLYMVKIAEDITVDGKTKTIKYELPVFANDSIGLYDIVNDYLKQGFDNMRLTTISETKWIYI
jgi:hypothetical protein